MRIGFFGGAFNPPTIAHFDLAKNAIENYSFDKIYFVPVNNFYHKKELIDIKQRIDMLQIMCSKANNIYVSEVEKENNRLFKAHEIFKLIENKYSKDDVYFLMGEDNFEKMPKWENYEQLKQYKYLVFQRKEEPLQVKKENIIYMKNKDTLNICSTEIRNKIKEKEKIDNLVTKEVQEYIQKNHLYTIKP